MNSRPLTKGEAAKLAQINDAGIESALLFLTETGLKKNILDATQPVRDLLADSGVHDYSSQQQGPDHKIKIPATVFYGDQSLVTEVSLYRPKTKRGDSRIWPGRLSSIASEEQVLAVFIVEGELFFCNLSDESYIEFDQSSAFTQLLEQQLVVYNSIADGLLYKLRLLAAKGPLVAVGHGDTAIGRTIETHLGIDINSSPLPDYKGIEIKSKRTTAKVRSNLFARVADWDLSHFKSSREIVEAIGYDIEAANCRKLYCTVSTQKPNPQGLFFDLDLDNGRLNELIKNSNSESAVAVWRLKGLHDKLHEKHRETFWVGAEQIELDGETQFVLKTVKHTRRPSSRQFDRLLGSGEITMDHLIKRTAKKTTEKGPLFKIKPQSIDELFLGSGGAYLLDS